MSFASPAFGGRDDRNYMLNGKSMQYARDFEEESRIRIRTQTHTRTGRYHDVMILHQTPSHGLKRLAKISCICRHK